jgi:hypothetical protein
MLMGFPAKGVPNAHTRVTPGHHTVALESLAIIEDSRSKSLGRNDIAHEVHFYISVLGCRGLRG